MSVHMRWNTLTWHVVICSHLVKIAESLEHVLSLRFVLKLNSWVVVITSNVLAISNREMRHYFLDSWLHELEPFRHEADALVRVHIICAVLKLIPVVLNSAVE